MSHIFAILFVIVSLIIKAVAEDKEKKKKAQQQLNDEAEKRRLEELRRMIAEAQTQNEQDGDEENEYYDEEEEYDEEQDNTPQYEPIPSFQDMPSPVNFPQPTEASYQREDMRPESLANNLPDEGISAFENNPDEISENNQCNNVDQESSLSIDDMRRAIVYQTILERPKY